MTTKELCQMMIGNTMMFEFEEGVFDAEDAAAYVSRALDLDGDEYVAMLIKFEEALETRRSISPQTVAEITVAYLESIDYFNNTIG